MLFGFTKPEVLTANHWSIQIMCLASDWSIQIMCQNTVLWLVSCRMSSVLSLITFVLILIDSRWLCLTLWHLTVMEMPQDDHQPIRSQYSDHMIVLDQSEASAHNAHHGGWLSCICDLWPLHPGGELVTRLYWPLTILLWTLSLLQLFTATGISQYFHFY